MIRELIANAKIDEASNKLSEFIDDIKGFENDVNQLNGRIAHQQQRKNKGDTNDEQLNIQLNQIMEAALFQCSQIEQSILQYFPTLKFKLASESLKEQLILKLIGKYKNIELVVNGTSAVFFRAKQVSTNRRVMLRVSKTTNFDSSDTILEQEHKRFEKFFGLKHRNIVRVVNAELSTFPTYLILEHISGVSLDHLIPLTPFSTQRTIAIFKQLAEAIYYLHINQIPHQNIKPDKILIDHELVPVISAFDIVSSSAKGLSTFSIDQLLYSSPELLKNEIQSADYQSDQFSLGLLMYELVTGDPIYCDGTRNAHEIVENRLRFFKSTKFRKERLNKLSGNKQLKLIISKMLSESPQDRFESMREVIQALEKVKVPSDEYIEIALDSYERCCIVNPNFVNDFYQMLFEEAEHKKEIAAIFSSNSSPLIDQKRSKMLRVAIDLLIHSKHEPEKLKRMLQRGVHRNIQPKLYRSFMQTIIKTIKVNDPSWKQKTSRDKIESAWQKVVESVNIVLQ